MPSSSLYKHILKIPLQEEINAVRAPKKLNIPVVLTRDEVKKTIQSMAGVPQLVVKLLYGSGIRIIEAVRLRVHDVDYKMKQLVVRSGKGNKDRVTTFPASIIPFMQNHLERVKLMHEADLARGFGEVYLPYALERKYKNAARDWNWQYIFPSGKLSVDPRSGKTRRHHVDPGVVNKAIKTAAKRLQINKKVSAHTFRHNADSRIMPIPLRVFLHLFVIPTFYFSLPLVNAA